MSPRPTASIGRHAARCRLTDPDLLRILKSRSWHAITSADQILKTWARSNDTDPESTNDPDYVAQMIPGLLRLQTYHFEARWQLALGRLPVMLASEALLQRVFAAPEMHEAPVRPPMRPAGAGSAAVVRLPGAAWCWLHAAGGADCERHTRALGDLEAEYLAASRWPRLRPVADDLILTCLGPSLLDDLQRRRDAVIGAAATALS